MQRLVYVRAQCRQGRRSVAPKVTDTCWRHFEQLLNWIVAFSCWILGFRILGLQIHFSVTVTVVTRLGVHSIVFMRRLSNEACETLQWNVTVSCETLISHAILQMWQPTSVTKCSCIKTRPWCQIAPKIGSSSSGWIIPFHIRDELKHTHFESCNVTVVLEWDSYIIIIIIVEFLLRLLLGALQCQCLRLISRKYNT